MWCSRCQQDVPAVATEVGGDVRCARCSQSFASEHGSSSSATIAIPQPVPGNSPWLDWHLNGELEAADSLIRRVRLTPIPNPAGQTFRVDRPHPVEQPEEPAPRPPTAVSRFLSWLLLTTGITSCVCGGALLALSFWGARADLLPSGIAFTLGGQASVLLGLLMQLDSLWRAVNQGSANEGSGFKVRSSLRTSLLNP
jgi:hypothetical protein